MRIGIIGLGFVGLSLLAVLGSKGYQVIGIDVNKKKLEMIKSGITPFFEPKLDLTLKNALKKNVNFSSSINDLTNKCDFIFVTVGTPQAKDGNIDLSMIKSATKELSKLIFNSTNKPTIIIKSTIIPGTTNNTIKPILEKGSRKKAGRGFGLITNPEFLRESQSVQDTLSPHIVILGGMKDRFQKNVEKFYMKFNQNVPIIQTNSQTAEIIKYANNSFLATKISFINQIAKICESIPGANIEDIAKAIGLDPRIGNLFLKAGPGYGGSCLPKDVKAIKNFCESLGINPILFEAVEKINKEQAEYIVKLIQKICGIVKNKKISILGLSFKPNTDDIRDSVSLELIKKLIKKEAKVVVHDPKATENVKKIFKSNIDYSDSIIDAIKDSYGIIIMTAWPEYSLISNKNLKLMKKPVIIDTQRILINSSLNCVYYAIGLGK